MGQSGHLGLENSEELRHEEACDETNSKGLCLAVKLNI
jgi:hypothetical protein